MKVGLEHAEAPADAADLDRLERLLERPLPADYRRFMLAHGGGRMEPNDQAVKEVFSLRNGAPNWQSLWWKLSVFSERLPDWLLPVADDEYGNLIAISTRQEDFGSVWHWDHEGEDDEADTPTECNIEWRAADWREFTLSLRAITGDVE